MRKLKTVSNPKPQIEPAPQHEKSFLIKIFMKTIEQVSKIEDPYLESMGIKSVAIMTEVLTKTPAAPRLIIKKMDDTQYSIDGYQEITDHLNDLFFPPPKESPKEEMDKCINCGCDTIYPVNMHIDFRMNYIEGAGQLCEKCFHHIYLK